MKSLRRVWAAAQRNPCAKRQSTGIGAEPKATITILIHFDRTLLWIPTGCALRWAQKDEVEIQVARGTRIVAQALLAIFHLRLR